MESILLFFWWWREGYNIKIEMRKCRRIGNTLRKGDESIETQA
jgi:hypothetical protein